MSEVHNEGDHDGDGTTRTINLDNMSLDELNQWKQREESRLQGLTQRYAQLRQVAARLGASQTAVTDLKQSAAEQAEIMVPLTESVYVPGRVKEPNTLLVELGTGYFVEKSAVDTVAYLDRKLSLVDKNSDNLTQMIQATRRNLEAIQQTMQGKLLEIRAKQEGSRFRAATENAARNN